MAIRLSQTSSWEDLSRYCASAVLRAPKTWGDPLSSFHSERPEWLTDIVNYLRNNVVGHPWSDHLVLLAAVLGNQHLQYKTILTTLNKLHCGFAALFPELGLHTMADWDADKHFRIYLERQILDLHTPYQRVTFWRRYSSSNTHLKRWFAGLPGDQQNLYRQYLLPSPQDPRELVRLSGDYQIRLDQQEKRKADTDALMPFYMDLRTQAHLRYNLMVRLRKAYYKAIQEVESGKMSLPFEFELREGGNERRNRAPTERLIFRLWDRRTFVLKHPQHFSKVTKWSARTEQKSFTPERNTYLLEFKQVESLDGASPVIGLWFLELLERRVLGEYATLGSPEEIHAKQMWLGEQGYGEHENERARPFQTETPGILLPSLLSGDGEFTRNVRERTGALFIPIESFYVAALFGMVALHIFTANGMRIGEILQLRATAECIVPIVLPPAPDAENPVPTVHWEVRAVPKGHRKLQPYYFDDEHLRLLSLLKYMLCERYGNDPKTGTDLPIVRYRGRDKHRFKPDHYLFQYDHQALTQSDLRACMRFLAHGLVFQTLDSRKVTILPHLLRHGFATWALNIAKEPVDIIGAILHQKNLDVTKYYGRPNARLIAERSHGLMTQISSYIDVEELILRSPAEIRQLLLDAQAKHGTLARVRGGRCLLSGECPILFACIGCAAKAPDPTHRGEVEETRDITLIQIQRAKKKGLSLEVIQLQKKLKQCDAEIREMEMIEMCREDELREPEVNFNVNR